MYIYIRIYIYICVYRLHASEWGQAGAGRWLFIHLLRSAGDESLQEQWLLCRCRLA